MAHPNARLTPLTRWDLVQMVRGDGYTIAEAARRFNVSRATAGKWVRRYDEGGRAALMDRDSRPRSSPTQAAPEIAARIVTLRKETGLGPHRIAEQMDISPSTTYAVLRRAGLNRLDHLHRVTREIVRYEHAHPGDLLHLDVKKLGRIPPGGGKRFLPEHAATYAETNSAPKSRKRLGFEHIHVAVDDHSRHAYAEALPDERQRHDGPVPGAGAGPLRVAGRAGAAYPDGQRRQLPQHGLRDGCGGTWHQAQMDAGLPSPDEREGGGIQQDAPERVGLRARLHIQRGAPGRPAGVPRPLQ